MNISKISFDFFPVTSLTVVIGILILIILIGVKYMIFNNINDSLGLWEAEDEWDAWHQENVLGSKNTDPEERVVYPEKAEDNALATHIEAQKVEGIQEVYQPDLTDVHKDWGANSTVSIKGNFEIYNPTDHEEYFAWKLLDSDKRMVLLKSEFMYKTEAGALAGVIAATRAIKSIDTNRHFVSQKVDGKLHLILKSANGKHLGFYDMQNSWDAAGIVSAIKLLV